jgi:hypothetical protein
LRDGSNDMLRDSVFGSTIPWSPPNRLLAPSLT